MRNQLRRRRPQYSRHQKSNRGVADGVSAAVATSEQDLIVAQEIICGRVGRDVDVEGSVRGRGAIVVRRIGTIGVPGRDLEVRVPEATTADPIRTRVRRRRNSRHRDRPARSVCADHLVAGTDIDRVPCLPPLAEEDDR